MNNEEGRAGSALADWIWVLGISFFNRNMTEQSKANEDILCVRTCAHTWNIVFVFLTHIKDDYRKKKKNQNVGGVLVF